MSADVSQLRALSTDLRLVSTTTLPKVRAAVRKTLFDIEQDAKATAPVDTGNLRNSISTEVEYGGMGGEVGPTAEYGIYVELGTSRMGAQPYLGPAFDRRAPQLSRVLASLAVEAMF